ncbi:MAG: hypothetical protein PHT44_00730 [Candidatus Portnoybacteria bacterium]|nr:hypothetical protein [Candidatus Portnoybacteria bacterium]MDD4982860.1 hypothetical protein [Candidatus Portnoybacteria bacterium]
MTARTHFFKGLRKGFVVFSENIGIFLNLFLLALVYFFGAGSVFLAAKIMGKKFLSLDIDKKAKTYWEKRSIVGEKKDNFFRQF